jgi:hypothetical protein
MSDIRTEWRTAAPANGALPRKKWPASGRRLVQRSRVGADRAHFYPSAAVAAASASASAAVSEASASAASRGDPPAAGESRGHDASCECGPFVPPPSPTPPPQQPSAFRKAAHVMAGAGASLVFNSALSRLQRAVEKKLPAGVLDSLTGAALSVTVGIILMLLVAWLFDKPHDAPQ